MPSYTIQDLAWMKGVPVPVRETLFSLEKQLTAAQAREAELIARIERLNKQSGRRLIGLCKCGLERDELRAHIERLRAALFSLIVEGKTNSFEAQEALAATPTQSLENLREQVKLHLAWEQPLNTK